MTGSHPMRWIVLLLCGALSVLGCVGSTDSPQGEIGSLSLELVLAGGTVIDEVDWVISRDGMEPMGGTVNTSAPGSTASIEVFGLLPSIGKDYTMTMEAIATDGETMCKGSQDFGIDVGEVTEIEVMLNCKLPERLGAVRVNGEFNICAELLKAVVSPLQTSVGNDIDLKSQAVDQDDDSITYMWSGDGGSFADSSAPSTTYTCLDVGNHEITISVTDNDKYCDMAEWTVPVTCVLGEVECTMDEQCDDGNDCTQNVCTAGSCLNPNEDQGATCNQDGGAVCDGDGNCVECNNNLDCDEGFVCDDNNDCVLDVECTMDEQCSDGDDCTKDLCTAGSCSNPNEDQGVTCDLIGQEDGFCDGNGTCVECNENQNCDEICFENECVSDPDIFCDTGICVNDDDAKQECVTAFLVCLQEASLNQEACIVLSLLECNECNDDQDCDEGFVCDDNNECVVPLECIDDTNCDEDGNPCTAAACENNTCGQVPTNETGSCASGTGSEDGSCSAGVCESNDECTADDGCPDDDGEECTVPVCVQTGAPYVCDEDSAPADGNECDGGNGECQAGACEPLGPPTFDLSKSVFRAYNNLLPDDPICATPSLFPGADEQKCVQNDGFTNNPADITGSVTFTNTGGNNWDVDVTQNLSFIIDTFIAAALSNVFIQTDSTTIMAGTGTGDVADGSQITLDALAAPNQAFNMNVIDCTQSNPAGCGGTVLCRSLNIVGVGSPCTCVDNLAPCDDCFVASLGQTCGNITAGECDPTDTSSDICGLAALGPGQGATCQKFPTETTDLDEAGCLNLLPNTLLENFMRSFNPVTFADNGGTLEFQLDGGPSDVDGWYEVNPYVQDPSQFLALSGVQQ
jgi:hypothetical protein